ncbi:MAG: PsbP-related protein [Nitrososphaeraceae archaeon]|nr:PsbP-related protein [Nitrososphaeraceae archaeon]
MNKIKIYVLSIPICLVFVAIAVMVVAVAALSLSISNVNAIVANNTDFSIDIPDNWAYEQGIFPVVALTPNEYGVLLVNHSKPLTEKMKDEGAFASFEQERNFPIKNADFDVYVNYKIDRQDGMNVTSKENVTLDNEAAVKIQGDGIKSFSGIKFVEYMLMHNEQPYFIAYMANVKDFEKYLPEFEQIVKSLKFVD